MRWLPFFILAYITLGVQIGLNPYAHIGIARPDFSVLVVVFITINAPRDTGLMACFVLGLMQDLLTVAPFGLFSLEYSILAMFVSGMQEFVYREHFLTHMSLGLVGSLLTGFITLVHGWIYPIFHSGLKTARASIGALFLSALYTGLLAPLVLGLLQMIRRGFGFRSHRQGSFR